MLSPGTYHPKIKSLKKDWHLQLPFARSEKIHNPKNDELWCPCCFTSCCFTSSAIPNSWKRSTKKHCIDINGLKIFILGLQQHGVEETAGNAQLHQVFTVANFCLKIANCSSVLWVNYDFNILLKRFVVFWLLSCYPAVFFAKKQWRAVAKFGCWVSQLRYASELKVQERRLWPQWPGAMIDRYGWYFRDLAWSTEKMVKTCRRYWKKPYVYYTFKYIHRYISWVTGFLPSSAQKWLDKTRVLVASLAKFLIDFPTSIAHDLEMNFDIFANMEPQNTPIVERKTLFRSIIFRV